MSPGQKNGFVYLPLKMWMNHDKKDFPTVIFWNYFVFSRRHSMVSTKNHLRHLISPFLPNRLIRLKRASSLLHFEHRAINKKKKQI